METKTKIRVLKAITMSGKLLPFAVIAFSLASGIAPTGGDEMPPDFDPY